MLKNSKIICVSFVFLFGLFTLVLFNCAGPKPQQDDPTSTKIEGSNLEEAKQAAESAEWEAHRLREELNRKKQVKE